MKKSQIYVIALIVLLTQSTLLLVLPIGEAQSVYHKTTYAHIGATPNPVGVNQETLLWIGISDQLQTAAHGWEGLTVTVTKPDGDIETIGPFRSDATGSTGTIFIPTMVGTYDLQTNFPAQWYNYSTNHILYEESTSISYQLIVTEEKVQYYPGHSLPTEYWTRPINAQLREWSPIAGNWLKPMRGPQFAPFNDDAPETGHVLWTKPLAIGGLVGGELEEYSFECGDAYEGLWGTTSPVIIGGTLFYNHYKERGGTDVEQEIIAVDLHTGEELWARSWNNTRLSFGQVFYWDSYNYHAAMDYLWSVSGSTWNAYDAHSGRWEYTMTNVPSGSQVYGPKGEIYIYTLNYDAGWMTLWNSSRVVSDEGSWRPYGNTYDATTGIEWNKTIAQGLPNPGRTIIAYFDDIIIGFYQGGTVIRGIALDDPPFQVWALSSKIGEEGKLLWNNTYEAPTGNVTLSLGPVDTEERIFTIWCKEHRTNYGYDLDTGEFLWGPTEPQAQLDIFGLSRAYERNIIAYGKLFSIGYSGTVYCYDVKTGDLLWDYEAKDPDNEILWSNNWPLYYAFIADRKLYTFHAEHSPINPKPRGGPFICLDIETGEEVWSMPVRGNHWSSYPAIGDSIIAMYNSYDQRIWAIGKGPSATSVTASPKSSMYGTNVILEGRVTDISPGASEYAITARFPDGLPAVSDESITDWMEYVYMQFERPSDTVGVNVKLEAVDPNNNYQNLGTVTTDEYGNYGFTFTPEVPGQYKIIATFGGSKAYYGSVSTTYLTVNSATSASTSIESEEPVTQTETTDTETPDTETPDTETPDTETPDTETPTTEAPLISTEVAIIAAVAVACVIGVAAFWALQKRK
ncbi:MAG: hypothetical protein CW691_00850 [Candidatus Bathyarchaeum sp.]|nr:MAG: hypothetical protein CW691_00850 [Candidatus Bathyarchaeum sp.]